MSKPPLPAIPAGSHTPESARGALETFEAEVLKHPQLALHLVQHFCSGVYARELHIPAGAVLTGKIHRYPCINLVLAGELEVFTEEGLKVVKAPAVFKSPAGVKRAARVFSDTIWVTVHANPDNVERDSDAMADRLTVPSFEEFDRLELHRKQIGE